MASVSVEYKQFFVGIYAFFFVALLKYVYIHKAIAYRSIYEYIP